MVKKSRRRWPWLVVAALLFALAAWLMAGSEGERPDPADKITLPRSMTHEESRRAEKRRTMPEPVAVVGQPPRRAQPRDPLLAAMPAEVKNGAMVIEANAIRNSDLGNLMVECMFTGEGDALGRMKDAGFDPLTNLDRVAIADDSLMLTGDFKSTDFAALMKAGDRHQFGANSELFSRSEADGGVLEQMGLWKGQVLVIGQRPEDVTSVLDRLDGKGDPDAKHVLSDADSYGEMYGVLKAGPLAAGISEENPALARLLEEAAGSIKLHADVTHDVGLVADVEGTDPSKTQDLRKAFGTALTLAKLQAEAEGLKDQAEVLGYARVAAADGASPNFRLEAGLPYEFLERQLKRCVADKKKRIAEEAAARSDAGSGSPKDEPR